MSPDEKKAAAARARLARGKKRRKRRRDLQPGDTLPRVRRTRGLVGVRKLAVAALQQQVEAMQDRFLAPSEREFLIELVKALVTGEKVAKLPTKPTAPLESPGEAPKTPLPSLDPRPVVQTSAQAAPQPTEKPEGSG